MVGFAVVPPTTPRRVNEWVAIDARRAWHRTLGSDHTGSGHVGHFWLRWVRTWSAWSPAASASISDRFWETTFPETRGGLMKRSASIMPALYAQTPGAMRAGFAPVPGVSARMPPTTRRFPCAGQASDAVLGPWVGEATFGPMIGAVVRCVAENVERCGSSRIAGHWITEEQPPRTTSSSSTFLHSPFVELA